jgi:outer membrane protein OmpA-like peptidoglycan-associated protein
LKSLTKKIFPTGSGAIFKEMVAITCPLFFFATVLLSIFITAMPLSASSSAKEISYNKLYEEGMSLYHRRLFPEALVKFERVTQECDSCSEHQFMIGRCLLDMGKPDEAATAFTIVLNHDSLHVSALYHLAVSAERSGDWSKSVDYFERRLTKGNVASEQALAIRRKIQLNKKRVEIEDYSQFNPPPKRLSNRVNHQADDYHPFISIDGSRLYFTSTRIGGMDSSGRQGIFSEDFWYSVSQKEADWGQAKNLGYPLNTIDSEGAGTLSGGGTVLYFSAYAREDGQGDCDLYFSELDSTGWSVSKNMGQPLNSTAWDSHPAISEEGDWLIFSSNRPGGYGGTDLWGSHRNANGVWDLPVNLGPTINTYADESGPFLHADGRSLYFASDGHPGFGSQDIFYSVIENGIWGKPVNLGPPINTPDPDLSFVVPGSGGIGYFASRRNNLPSLDLYKTEVPQCCRPEIQIIISGRIIDAESKKTLVARVRLEDMEGLQETQDQFSKSAGNFVFAQSPGNWLISSSCPGYLFGSKLVNVAEIDGESVDWQDEKEIWVELELLPLKVGMIHLIENVHFDFDQSDIAGRDLPELKSILELLQINPTLKIEIRGHTDDIGDEKYNIELSQKRADIVRDWLLSEGIKTQRIVAQGYGKSNPKADNSQESGREINRRTEFRIIEY